MKKVWVVTYQMFHEFEHPVHAFENWRDASRFVQEKEIDKDFGKLNIYELELQ